MSRPYGLHSVRRAESLRRGGASAGIRPMAISSISIFQAIWQVQALPHWCCFMAWKALPPATTPRPWHRSARSAAGIWPCRIFAAAAVSPITCYAPTTPAMRTSWTGFCAGCVKARGESCWPWECRWAAMPWRAGPGCSSRRPQNSSRARQ